MTLARRLVAEAVGTALLVAAVVGSGIMAERLAGPDVALALLANTLATGAALVALILGLGPISGAHFNPIVSVWAAVTGELRRRDAAGYVGAQLVGALAGALVANAMFELALVGPATTARHGRGLLLGEVVATFGLLGIVVASSRRRAAATPYAVAAYIVAAYWFTSSTSFANPAVTVARAATDSFTGIRPGDVPAFVAAQAVGGTLAALLFGWLTPGQPRPQHASPAR